MHVRSIKLGSIRSKLLIAFFVVFLPLSIFNTTSYNQVLESRIHLMRATEDRFALFAATAIDCFIEELVREEIAATNRLKHITDAELSACLELVSSDCPHILSAAIVDSKGVVMAQHGEPMRSTPQPFSSIPAHGFRVSDFREGSDGQPFFAVDRLALLPGDQEAIIHCEAGVDAVLTAVKHAVPEQGRLILTDSAGKVICATSGSGIDSGDVLGEDSTRGAIRGEAISRLSGWTIFSMADPAELRGAYAIWRFRVLGSLAITVFGLLMVVFFANRTSARIKKLGWGAEALAVGDLRKRFSIESGDELESLADTLNTMAENIETRERSIAELTAALDGLFGIARAAASSLDLGEILRGIARETADVLRAKSCAIYLLDPDDKLVIREAHNLSKEFVEQVKLEVGDRWTGIAVSNRHWVSATGLKNDPDFHFREHVEREGLESLLSAPLIAGASVLGAVTVWTEEAREFTQLDVHVLTTTADHAAAVIKNAQLYDKESRISETLQSTYLGKVPPQIGPLQFGARYLAGSQEANVGGDLYDAFPLPDGQIAVVVADVAGKGLRAAMHTAMVKFILRAYALEAPDDPGRAMERLNAALTRDSSLQPFATVLLAVVDPERECITLVNAGHPPAILLLPGGKQQVLLYKTGIPVGCNRDATYGVKVVPFKPSSRLFLFTDGVMEARTRDGEFGLESLEAALFETYHSSVQVVVDDVCERVLDFTGGRMTDDIAVVAVRMDPAIVEDMAQEEPADDNASVISEEPGPKLVLKGDLDLFSAEIVDRALRSFIERADCGVEVDMTGVVSVSSLVLRRLADARKAAEDKGISLTVSEMRPQVFRALQVTGIAPLLGLPPLFVDSAKRGAFSKPEITRNTDWQITESVVSNDPVLIAGLRDLAAAAARETGASDEEIVEIILAIEEALARAIDDTSKGSSLVHLRCLGCRSALVAELTFDCVVPADTPAESQDVGEDGGLDLMRHAVNEVEIFSYCGKKRIRLVKWFRT
jgi:phosphoserine phosphatase RsbU/P